MGVGLSVSESLSTRHTLSSVKLDRIFASAISCIVERQVIFSNFFDHFELKQQNDPEKLLF
jgi:hypothetical protein